MSNEGKKENKSKYKNWIVFAVVAILIIISVFVVIYFTKEKPTTYDQVNVRLKWIHQAQFAGFYTADKKGFYKENNISIDLRPGGVDFPATKMVASGDSQFGVAGAIELILAREKGMPVVAIATIYRKNPFVFIAKKSSGITKPQDFIKKKVGYTLDVFEEVTYRALMKNAGINPSQYEEVPVKYDMSPFFSGEFDVWPAYIINQAITAKEKGFEINVIWPSDYGINLYADTIFTTEDMIKNKPDLVKRFLNATLKGWDYAVKNPDEAARYTLEYSSALNYIHEKSMMNTSVGLIIPDDKPIGWMEREKWEEMQKLLLEYGFMKNAIDLNKVYTTKFLEEIYKK